MFGEVVFAHEEILKKVVGPICKFSLSSLDNFYFLCLSFFFFCLCVSFKNYKMMMIFYRMMIFFLDNSV